MLVLTRKKEQKILIGEGIVITILKVQGEQVSVGIEAPRSLPILREELADPQMREAAAEENKQSALTHD